MGQDIVMSIVHFVHLLHNFCILHFSLIQFSGTFSLIALSRKVYGNHIDKTLRKYALVED